jgi:hypothetical protein
MSPSTYGRLVARLAGSSGFCSNIGDALEEVGRDETREHVMNRPFWPNSEKFIMGGAIGLGGAMDSLRVTLAAPPSRHRALRDVKSGDSTILQGTVRAAQTASLTLNRSLALKTQSRGHGSGGGSLLKYGRGPVVLHPVLSARSSRGFSIFSQIQNSPKTHLHHGRVCNSHNSR